jgi:hypothetical protein
MASRIAKKGYEPHSIPVRARLGLKPYCFVCKQAIRKPRVKREPGKPSALSEARKILAKYATQGAPEAMWWIKEYGG